jgi:hypothetical protein
MSPGLTVRKLHKYDETPFSGQPEGPPLRVIQTIERPSGTFFILEDMTVCPDWTVQVLS